MSVVVFTRIKIIRTNLYGDFLCIGSKMFTTSCLGINNYHNMKGVVNEIKRGEERELDMGSQKI